MDRGKDASLQSGRDTAAGDQLDELGADLRHVGLRCPLLVQADALGGSGDVLEALTAFLGGERHDAEDGGRGFERSPLSRGGSRAVLPGVAAATCSDRAVWNSGCGTSADAAVAIGGGDFGDPRMVWAVQQRRGTLIASARFVGSDKAYLSRSNLCVF